MLPSRSAPRTSKPSSLFGRVKRFGWGSSWKQYSCTDDQTLLDLESVSHDHRAEDDDATTACSSTGQRQLPLHPKFQDGIEVVLTNSLSKEDDQVSISSDLRSVVDTSQDSQDNKRQPTNTGTQASSSSSSSSFQQMEPCTSATVAPSTSTSVLLPTSTTSKSSTIQQPTDDAIDYILNNLSEQELETAAMASHQYCLLQTQAHDNSTNKGTTTVTDNNNICSNDQLDYASQLIQRHLIAEQGNTERTLSKIKATLQFRRDWKVNETRQTFHDNSPQSLKRQRRIAGYLGGDAGKLFVRGFDRQGHACIHYIMRHNNHHSNNDSLGCMLAFLYTLEKAIACSERHPHNTDGMITVSVDLKGFQPKLHVPPMDALQQLVLLLKEHYPERLFRVTFVDAPILFRYVWAVLLKPRINDPTTRDKFHFVTGRFQRNRWIRGGGWDLHQCMPYQHAQGKLVADVDMEAFYQLPLDQAYGA
ncbi:CRAL TRIO domain protein [Seminavis robusta]|uniref:CRAL TRIO domain protein n=1 Tax=Seminavis robusta TaxID=568900 RepID=A0A9N8HGH8_9STRA|nr:CRAL TRIO domain protein [Seminavis robusta]|eukprot:Sro636_g179240.1 CRAL TRIO domain protein (475) ;mRNA; f:18555-19979